VLLLCDAVRDEIKTIGNEIVDWLKYSLSSGKSKKSVNFLGCLMKAQATEFRDSDLGAEKLSEEVFVIKLPKLCIYALIE
jgi:hypothetical protein